MSAADIELKNLNGKPATPSAERADDLDIEMNHATSSAAEMWAYGTSAWLALLALPHVAFPRLLVLMASPESGATPEHHPMRLTQLESFLSLHFGVLLLAVALSVLVSIPSASPTNPRRSEEPVPHPMLTPLSLGLGAMSFVAYHSSLHGLGAFPMVVSTGCGAISMWGFWVMFFAHEGRKSKKTGADKRTSAFLFGNKSSAFEQKKEYNKARE